MPTYDYLCDACNKKYELRESFSADSTHVCKKCGKGTAKRQITPPAIVFKGSGFYVTDSSKSSVSTLASENGKSSDNGKGSNQGKSSDSGNSAASTESKPKKDTKGSSKTTATSSSSDD